MLMPRTLSFPKLVAIPRQPASVRATLAILANDLQILASQDTETFQELAAIVHGYVKPTRLRMARAALRRRPHRHRPE